MLSSETIEMYRRMTPSQRLVLTLRAIRESTPYLLHGPKEVVDRRFVLIRRENDARNRAMLEALGRAYGRAEEAKSVGLDDAARGIDGETKSHQGRYRSATTI
jgi:hypothetical protein